MNHPTVAHITELNLDNLAPGEIHRFQLELMQDPLSTPVCIPLMVARVGRLSRSPIR